MQNYLAPYGQMGPPAMSEDTYANDIARHLSITGASSSEDVICQLRGMNLGDDFWMYSFKVAPCSKTFSHKWTLCPCAHAGETARRRDPRLQPYRAVLCPLVKAKKACPMGDNCLWSHNVFEHWLHPSRYKTRLCSFGRACNRPICFFAHSSEELRTQPADDVERGKEADEREYLMQLMLAQEAGILPPGSLPQHAFMQQSGGLRGSPGVLDSLLMMGLGSGAPLGVQNNGSHYHGHHGSHSSNGRYHGPPAHSSSGPLPHQYPQQQMQQQSTRQHHQQMQQQQQSMANQRHTEQQQQAATLLMNLQESLISMGSDLNWSNEGGQGVRISDPGSEQARGHQMLKRMASSGHAILKGVRASDSGQALNKMSHLDSMDELAPMLSEALAGHVKGNGGGVSAASSPPPQSSGSSHSHNASPPHEMVAGKGCGPPVDSPLDPSSGLRFLSRNSSDNRSSDGNRASAFSAATANGGGSTLSSVFSGSHAEWDPSAEAALRYLSRHPSVPTERASCDGGRGAAGSPELADLTNSAAAMLAALIGGPQQQQQQQTVGEPSAAETAALRMLSRNSSAADRTPDGSLNFGPSYTGGYGGLRANNSSCVNEVFIPDRSRRESAPQGNSFQYGGTPPPPPPPPVNMPGQRDSGIMPFLPTQQHHQHQHQRRESLGAPAFFAPSPLHHPLLSRGASGPLLSNVGPQQQQQRHLPGTDAAQDGIPSGALPGLGSIGGPAGSGNAYVSQLVAQLQEQGVVQSKEELVQSLSHLLAQLLVNP